MRTIELDGSNFMQVSTLHTKRADGKNTCAARSKRSALVIACRRTVSSRRRRSAAGQPKPKKPFAALAREPETSGDSLRSARV
jgi:hypothetical protein